MRIAKIINSEMSVGSRLTLISGVFVASTVFATGLFVETSLSNISFTAKERDGAEQLTDVWSAIETGATPAGAAVLRSQFAAGDALDSFMNASGMAARLETGRALITAVADGSNLTLDPDLDTFYAMDAITVRLPTAKHRIFELQTLLSEGGSDPRRIVAKELAFERMNLALIEAQTSLKASIKNNKDGATEKALQGVLVSLAGTTTHADNEVNNSNGDLQNQRAVKALQTLSSDVDATWTASRNELARLLKARQDRMTKELIAKMAIILLALGAAGALACGVSRGLADRLKALLITMDALQTGDKTIEVPCLDDKNETGKIGHTLEMFKQSLIEKERTEREAGEEQRRNEGDRRKSAREALDQAQSLVEAFSTAINALVVGNYKYRIVQDLPTAYDSLKTNFHTALDKLSEATRAAEEANRLRTADRLAAEEARTEAEKAAIAASERLVVETFGEGLSALAAGNFTYRMVRDIPEAYLKLRNDFNASMGSLQQVLLSIVQSAKGVRACADEVTQASDDLSRRTETQAATLEQTAAALDEITATVQKTAHGAVQTNNVVESAQSHAIASGHVVLQAVSAMGEIEKSSKQVSQIIGVIDEIAFQTNLLALNAGVEAARAADAGRGFAVVAQEVRALAQRSSDAAKEIKTLISASSQQVGVGVKLVDEAGASLSKIVAQVTQISGLVAEISASAQEQAIALGEVNNAINQMDQATQQNAAMVEQTTAASHSLNSEAEDLSQKIQKFKIDDGTSELRSTPRYSPLLARKKASAVVLRPLKQTESWEEFQRKAKPRGAQTKVF